MSIKICVLNNQYKAFILYYLGQWNSINYENQYKQINKTLRTANFIE